MKQEFLKLVQKEGFRPRRLFHVGANIGQEIAFYEENVIEAWHIEAIPDLYQQFELNYSRHKDQHSAQALLSDIDGKEAEFNIATIGGSVLVSS